MAGRAVRYRDDPIMLGSPEVGLLPIFELFPSRY